MIDLIYTILAIVCLSAGFYFGFKIGKYSDIPKVPEEIKHPVRLVKKKREENRQEKEDEKINKILRNIDNYDGTSLSQEDF